MSTMVQTFKDMGQGKLITMAGAVGLLTLALVIVSLRFSSGGMSTLYSGLSMEDSAHIVSELDKNGVKYELSAGGTQIAVPNEQVLKMRLTLAGEGIPSGGSIVGYEIFDKSESLGTSNFVLNVNMLRALEGELARTISSVAQVETARVHLVVPKRELFSREKQETTASVALKLRGANELSKNEIAAIRNLVATATPGLKASAITIVDNKGRMLAKGGTEDDVSQMSMESSADYRTGFETRLRTTVEDLLSQSLGAGKVKAQVSADIDFDRIVINSEKYDPEGQVVRSIQGIEERETATEGGAQNVSVANNLPGGAAQGGNAGGGKTTVHTDETTNYEISKTVENHVKESGNVKRLSVAVLVDGAYRKDAAGADLYVPRTEKELKDMEAIVKTAVGFDAARGDTVTVSNMQFSKEGEVIIAEEPFDWLKKDAQSIIQTLVMGGVAVLVVLLVIRPVVTRIVEAAATAQAAAAERVEQLAALAAPAGGMAPRLTAQGGTPALAGGAGQMAGGSEMVAETEEDEMLINLDRVQGRVKSSSFNKITSIVEKHPDETLNVIRQWINKEE